MCIPKLPGLLPPSHIVLLADMVVQSHPWVLRTVTVRLSPAVWTRQLWTIPTHPVVAYHYHCIPGRRDEHLHLHFLSSTSCREHWGHLSASFSLSWASLELLSGNKSPSPFSSFAVLLWTHPRTWVSFLNCGAQNYAQYSRWGCTKVE